MLLKLNDKSYICGAAHAGHSGMYPLPEKVYRATEKCTCIAVEADPRIRPSKEFMERAKNLENLICEKTKAMAAEFLREKGIEADASNPFLTVAKLNCEKLELYGLKLGLGTEMHLIPFFEKVIGIEGLDYHLEIFERIAGHENASDIIINNIRMAISGSFEDFEIMFSHIREGRYDEMFSLKLMQMLMGPTGDIYLTERNERMVDIIEHLESEGEAVFVHVGAAHIGGENGIVKMLRYRGGVVEKA